ncbi:citrate lyase holo-[acyl-carrier protein] synthase [Pelobacter propionicus]|uniref:citrate lyase holo-[acyl-carrier protein] synthase n=1 Tax=Pelobacter propionicus (strain DSM 2379 / NBRC 103807 / OttBd1) TaxID=338966 RepID=A1AMY8_PELPD|nr:citrate lyase holo-[acyl-carrier protein] synthase [Pelobacter propionicus]ABK98708.1 Apo-citrate lyase phosphoribosyl-dephospho-CoA transferase [Pelobacter propionicus DSM 2379]
MSSAESRSSILAAREARQELLDRHSGTFPAFIFLSLNIPGECKTPPGTEELFSWALERLETSLPHLHLVERGSDRLGPFALLAAGQEAAQVKRLCVSQEESSPVARLIDLDVYDRSGVQIGRGSLGLPPRPCLVCHHPAVDCMRLGRHNYPELAACAERLLAEFSKAGG